MATASAGPGIADSRLDAAASGEQIVSAEPPVQRLGRWMRRHLASADEFAADRHRVYVLPTRYGLIFFSLLVVMYLWSTNYGLNLGFLLVFFLLGLGAISAYWVNRNLLDLRIKLLHVEHGHEGGVAEVRYRLENPHDQPRIGLLVAIDRQPVDCIDIAARGRTDISVPVECRQRGWNILPPLKVSSDYPLGLFNAWTWAVYRQPVLAYPKAAGSDLQIEPRRQEDTDDDALDRSSINQEGDADFGGLVAYSPGVSLRRVDWKRYARTRELTVRRFNAQASSGEDCLLHWDDTAGMDYEARIRQLAKWVLMAHDRRLNYALIAPGIVMPAGRGFEHLHLCLKALALSPRQDDRSLTDV